MVAENRGPELAGVIIFFLAFTFITVGLRCYTMGHMMKRFYVEDWLAVVTLVLYMAYSLFALVAIHFGLGQHISNIPAGKHHTALLFKWLGQVFYVLIAVLVKFIVGLFLLRICSHKKWQRVTIYTLLSVVFLFNTFYIFIVILQCIPVEFYWFRYTVNSPVHGKCNKTKLAVIPTYISLMLNVLSDFTLALLPVSFVWNSKMQLGTKISVVGVLALGSIASLATAARIPYAKQLLSNPDYLYNFTDLAIWSTVEIGLGLSASSLATLKPLFRKFKILATTRKSEGNGIKHTARSSTMHSRKMSALNLRFGAISKPSTAIEDGTKEGPKSSIWSNSLTEKIDDMEMGILGEQFNPEKNRSFLNLYDSEEEENAHNSEKLEHINFSLRRPLPAHVRTDHIVQ